MVGRWRAALAASIFCLALATLPVGAQSGPHKAIGLSASDQLDVQRIESWLNNEMRSLKANFLQVGDRGELARGVFYLQRPGKLRFTYEPPSPILMVSDGSFLIYHDSALQQTSYIPLNTTPIGFLVRNRIEFSGDLTITRFERGPGVLRVSLRQTKEWDQGELTLVFSDKPLLLQQWVVLDAQNRTTRVSLLNMQLGVKNDNSLFFFTPPSLPDEGR